MFPFLLTLLLSNLQLTTAHRSPTPFPISKRDFCDGLNARPILYEDYTSRSCPPIHTLNPDGTCSGLASPNACQTFCQVRTSYAWTREHPYTKVYCRGPELCELVARSVTIDYTDGQVDPQFLEAFRAGVSGGYAPGPRRTLERAYSVKLKEDECGYLSFLPVKKSICGSISRQKFYIAWCEGKIETLGNICGEELRARDDGSVDGDGVVVRTDCATHKRLPMKLQDPAYRRPGVAMTDEAFDEIEWPLVDGGLSGGEL